MFAIRMPWTTRQECKTQEEKERKDAIAAQYARSLAERRARYAGREPLSQKSTTDRYGAPCNVSAPADIERLNVEPSCEINRREESALGGLFGGMALALVLVIATLFFVRWWLK